jgi:predicted secreted protein
MNYNEAQLKKIKEGLLNLYASLPDQFALQDVKSNFRRLLESINTIEKKRTKRKQTEQQTTTMAFTNLEDAQNALKILDDMMKNQQNQINKMEKPPETNSNNGQSFLLG